MPAKNVPAALSGRVAGNCVMALGAVPARRMWCTGNDGSAILLCRNFEADLFGCAADLLRHGLLRRKSGAT